MIKYTATAFALKGFSLCGPTRSLYRFLGNAVGGRDRAHSKMPVYYIERVQRMLDLAKRFNLLRDGTRMVELGTGWMHWEALTTRLFFDIQADLYELWDNRQLDALKSYLKQLLNNLDQLTSITPAERTRATALAAKILEVPDFDTLYKLLGFRYVLEPEGMLAKLSSDSYDLAVSGGVFEHLPREGVPEYIRQTYRVLKPGSYAIHSINTTDHLHLYDRTASAKNYLRYSDRKWRLLFENQLQYINRLQRCEWMDIFERAGFVCLEEISSRCDLSDITIHQQYRHIDKLSLETTSWNAVYQKPAGQASKP
jgi:SAM-dependent methyltransferase